MKYTLIPLALLACAACASAEDPELEKVRKAVVKHVPEITAEMVTRAEAPGLYQIRKGGAFAYVTRDGRYLIQGNLVDLVTGEDLTEKQLGGARLAVLEQFGPDRVIEFAPKDGAKHWVTVFTDIDCGFCRQLHADMAEYHAHGIGVRYLFFPRSGPGTPSFAKAQSVWCSADRREALTQAKRGSKILAPTACTNPIQAHWDAALAIGVNATPMIILPDGNLIRGYTRAPALAARLDSTLKKAELQR